MRFADRAEAGRLLGQRLLHLLGQDLVVLGLPRGGVPVAAEVAAALGAPLDVVVVRKLGVPFQPELAMGAIGEGGARSVNDDVVAAARVTPDQLAEVEARERTELERRAVTYRRGRSPLSLGGRTVVVVDDGIATGATARAAGEVVRALGAPRTVLAVPVGAPDSLAALAAVFDEVVAVAAPAGLGSVGAWYDDFRPTSDADVVALLGDSAG